VITAILSPRKDLEGDTGHVLAPDVLLLLLRDGTARLLNMAGRFYALPAVGAAMLRDTLQWGASAAAQRTAAEYGVEVRRVQADLDAFLHDLEKQRLIARPLSGQPTRRAGRVWPALLLGPALRFTYWRHRTHESRAGALLKLARLSFRLFGWARTLALWERHHPPVEGGRSAEEQKGIAQAIDSAVRAVAARQLFRVECKERSLSCWSLARRAGIPAALVVGVNLCPLAGHCWCESGPWTLGDDRAGCADYVPVLRHE
jgi:hypothetical protein